jgi:hypothetical protein
MRVGTWLSLLWCAALACPLSAHADAATPAPPGSPSAAPDAAPAHSPPTPVASSTAAVPLPAAGADTPAPVPDAADAGTRPVDVAVISPPVSTVPDAAGPVPKHVLTAPAADDAERAPPADAANPEQGPWLVRLSLGIQAGLLRQSGATQLRKPTFANLDLGYAPTRHVILLLRVSSWLAYEPYALQFVGAGASYFFAPDGMFVTGVLGVSVLDDRAGLPGDSGEVVQGLSAQVDVGQQWALSQHLGFCLGAHIEVGTPWLRGVVEATDLGVGIFVSLSYR